MSLAFEPLSHKVDHISQNKIMYSKFERSSNTNKEQTLHNFSQHFFVYKLYHKCMILVT